MFKGKKTTKISILIWATLTLFGLSACGELDDIDLGLTQEEIAEGLRSALIVGTDTSVSILSVTDGYYKDDLVKILLPEEAGVIVDNIGRIPGGNLLVEETIKAINRSAEDAAKSATPIFVNAITAITFQDARDILEGEDDAATTYLMNNTRDSLTLLFEPQINKSLSKELIPGISAQKSYASLVDRYNIVAENSFGLLKPVVSNSLSEHTTTKALDGLSSKIALEEGKIRNNVSHRVNDILKKVFGD
jgi:hypothetical protein